MLGSRLVRETDALLQIEIMAWMIRRHGSPARPDVPSPLHRATPLEASVWMADDQRSETDWAQDVFARIQDNCHMSDWALQLMPSEAEFGRGPELLSDTLPSRTETPYHVDDFGRPIVFYDPRRISEPGYFVSHIVLRLAELAATGFKPQVVLSPLLARMVTLGAASYLRQGFSLVNLAPQVADDMTASPDIRDVPLRIINDTLCFSTCLGLRARRQSFEQIIATYGTRMPKSFRKKVKLACKQINGFDTELKLLQVLSEPKPQMGVNRMQRSVHSLRDQALS